ncbi:MAG: septum site-determining protein MinC [Clostridia bacterium]|nr:septum site-determining protein MinC [Clostridia bacterium]
MVHNCVTIKGTLNGLMIILDTNRDFDELRENLAAKFAAAQGFFQGATVSLLPTSPLSHDQTEELEAICREYGLVPKAGAVYKPFHRKRNAARKAKRQAAGSLTEELPTLLEEGNLRNGQVIESPGHVMFVGAVHQGALIKAAGNILVMGNLMGSAYAGINGNRQAVIIAHRLFPEQLAIAGVIARSPEHNTRRPYPEIARLINNKIVIEPYLNIKRI